MHFAIDMPSSLDNRWKNITARNGRVHSVPMSRDLLIARQVGAKPPRGGRDLPKKIATPSQ